MKRKERAITFEINIAIARGETILEQWSRTHTRARCRLNERSCLYYIILPKSYDSSERERERKRRSSLRLQKLFETFLTQRSRTHTHTPPTKWTLACATCLLILSYQSYVWIFHWIFKDTIGLPKISRANLINDINMRTMLTTYETI